MFFLFCFVRKWEEEGLKLNWVTFLVGKNFREHIRTYNNVLSFCSLGVEIDESVTGQRGVYTFRIKGALCHKIGSLLPAEGEQPKFAQIYIADSDPSQQIQQRLQHGGDNIVESILRDLQTMMHRDNPYYAIYKTAKERMSGYRLSAQSYHL